MPGLPKCYESAVPVLEPNYFVQAVETRRGRRQRRLHRALRAFLFAAALACLVLAGGSAWSALRSPFPLI